MSFRKKALYYGLMLFLTLLALEGMAWLAYYAAYGQGYGGGRLELPEHITPPPSFIPVTGWHIPCEYCTPFTAIPGFILPTT